MSHPIPGVSLAVLLSACGSVTDSAQPAEPATDGPNAAGSAEIPTEDGDATPTFEQSPGMAPSPTASAAANTESPSGAASGAQEPLGVSDPPPGSTGSVETESPTAGAEKDLGPIDFTDSLCSHLGQCTAPCAADFAVFPELDETRCFSVCSFDTYITPGDVAGCEVVRGDLYLSAFDSLEAMQNLRMVTGDFVLTGTTDTGLDHVVDLTGLEKLVIVGGTLRIVFNLGLESLNGLDSLRQVGSLSISFSPLLTNLEGLRHADIGTSVELESLDALTSLDGLNLSECDVRTQGTPLLTDLSALESLTVGTVAVDHAADRVELSSLTHSKLIAVGQDVRAPVLREVAKLRMPTNFYAPELVSIEELEMGPPYSAIGRSYAHLETVEMPKLSHVEHLVVQTLDNEDPFAPLASLQTVGGLELTHLLVTDLSGLSHVSMASGRVEIEYNPNLTTLSGLEGVTALSSLEIWSNPELTDLDGLDSLRTVESMTIRENPKLQSVDGLQNLEHTESADVLENEQLLDCSQIAEVADTCWCSACEG